MAQTTNRILSNNIIGAIETMFVPRMKFAAAACILSWAVLRLAAQDDFETLSRQAAAALQSNPAEAAKLYRRAVGIKPAWAEGWFYLAASLYGAKQYGESQTAFERAAKLAPDNGTNTRWACIRRRWPTFARAKK
jgi:tetratricopeptide (TPR) repeat protein